ncbi:MAG: phospholipase A, partial [Alistipes sp.]|nr:phospholipase A [Alistipes sp.]
GVTPSLYAQYSYGYGDTMLDYNRRHSAVRIGIALKNDWLNFY